MPDPPVRPGRHRTPPVLPAGPVVRQPWDVLADARARLAGPGAADDEDLEEDDDPEGRGPEGWGLGDTDEPEARDLERDSRFAGRLPRWWSEVFDRLPAGGQRVAVDLGRHWWLPVVAALVALVLTVAIALRARPVATAAPPSRPTAVALTPAPSSGAGSGARATPSLSLVAAPTATTGPAGATTSPAAAPVSATVPAAVVVDVAGRVHHPGVVRLPGGSRVIDAIRAAGGALPRTDLTALNLAEPLLDGEQVRVGLPGTPVVAATVDPGGGTGADPGAAPTTAAAMPDPTAPLDVNTADAAGLDQLPGIGPVLAARILAWRTAHGPFGSVDALGDVPGIGPATLARLRDLITTDP